MSSKLNEENSPFVFILNKLNGEPILGVSFSCDSENKINLNQTNIISIPNLVENSFKLIENIKTIYNILPKKIIISACKSEYGTATIVNNNEYYLDLPEKFLSVEENLHFFEENLTIDTAVIEDLQTKLSSIINIANTEYIKPLNTTINYMYNSLKKYFTFISIFNDVGKCLTSTLRLNSQENQLAEQVFNTIPNKDQINQISENIDQNLFHKQLGNVLVFYFYLRGKYFFLYSIDIEINIGITKLKLITYLKNNENDIVSILESLNLKNPILDHEKQKNKDSISNREYIKITLEIS